MGKFKEIWQRDKDGDKRVQRSFIRCAIVSTFLCLLFLLLKRDSLISWIEAGFQIRNQKRQIEFLEKEIERLDSQTRMLVSDKDSLEQFARETYDFTAAGEELYITE